MLFLKWKVAEAAVKLHVDIKLILLSIEQVDKMLTKIPQQAIRNLTISVGYSYHLLNLAKTYLTTEYS